MTYKPFVEHIVYDGVNLAHFFDISDVTIDPYPERTINTVNVPGRGLQFTSVDNGCRNISMKMSIKGKSRHPLAINHLWSRVSQYVLKDEPKPMQFESEKEINVILSSSEQISRLATRGVSVVSFQAVDPCFYGRRIDIPLSTGRNTVYINSQFPVWPTIEVSGISGSLTVTNNITGDQIRIPSVGSVNSTVVIDMLASKCFKDGVYLPIDMTVSDFFDLPPGEASIQLSGGNGILSYREVSK